MKLVAKIIVWLAVVAATCSWSWNLLWSGGGNMQELPSSSLKFRVQDGQTAEQAFETAKSLLESRGYVDQNWYDDGTWSSSQDFIKGNFEVGYQPHDAAQSELRVIYIYFYERDVNLFSDAGIEEYNALSKNFSAHGLNSLGEVPADKANNRRVETPQMFNERQDSPAKKASQRKVLQFQISMLVSYSVIVFLPGFSLALRYFNHLSFPRLQSRILFSFVSGLFLTPGLFMLPPFGPLLLVPLPLALLFAFLTAAGPLLIWAGISFLCTLVLAFLISFIF
jgi:hypothetical protein